jgi:hypothetical protein
VVVVEFANSAIRRDCCDLRRMRQAWGIATARRISQRLQQLEAMHSLSDLSFLPFDWAYTDGAIEVVVDDAVSLLFEVTQTSTKVEGMTTIVIRGLRTKIARSPS